MSLGAEAISPDRYTAGLAPGLARLLAERLPSDEEIETLLHLMDLPESQVEHEVESVRAFMQAWIQAVCGHSS